MNGPGHKGELGVANLAGKPELALSRIGIREIPEITPDAHRHITGGTLYHGVANVVTHLRRDAQWQIAVDPGAFGPGDGARQIQHTRETRPARRSSRVAGTPGAPRLPFRIRIRKPDAGLVDLYRITLQLPTGFGVKTVETQPRFFEDAWELQPPIGNVKTYLSAPFVHGEIHPGATESRISGRCDIAGSTQIHGTRTELQVPARHTDCITLQRAPRPLPASLDLLQHARCRMPGQNGVGLCSQRKPASQLAQHRQVQFVCPELSQRRLFPLPGLINQLNVATGPDQSIGSTKLKIAGLELESARKHAPTQSACDRLHRQRVQAFPELHRNPSQREVSPQAGHLPLHHVAPETQCARALADIHIQAQVPAQTRHINAGEITENLSIPVVPLTGLTGQQRAPKLANQREPRPPALRRRRVDAQLMPAGPIANHDVDIMQIQRFAGAHFIGPADVPAAYDDLSLRQEPVGQSGVTPGTGCVHPGEQEPPLCVPADIEFGPFQIQLVKTQSQYRLGGERYQYPRQLQSGSTLRVQKLKVPQFDRRNQPSGTRAKASDAYGNAQNFTGNHLQRRAICVDSWQNPAV